MFPHNPYPNYHDLTNVSHLYRYKLISCEGEVPTPGYLSLPGSHNYFHLGAPDAQYVKHCPADLAVPRSIPAKGEIFNNKWDPFAHNFSVYVYHPPIVLM